MFSVIVENYTLEVKENKIYKREIKESFSLL